MDCRYTWEVQGAGSSPITVRSLNQLLYYFERTSFPGIILFDKCILVFFISFLYSLFNLFWRLKKLLLSNMGFIGLVIYGYSQFSILL